MLLQRAIFDCLFFPVEGGPFEDKFGMNRILFRTSKCNYKYTFFILSRFLKQVSPSKNKQTKTTYFGVCLAFSRSTFELH